MEKDVDGFHPMNMGNLALRGRGPLFIPCAAKACIELLIQSGVELQGKNVVVIGQSKVVGLPTSLLLQVAFKLISYILHFIFYIHFFEPKLYFSNKDFTVRDGMIFYIMILVFSIIRYDT